MATDRPVEPFVRAVTRVVGGPLGRHAGQAPRWFTPATVAILFATVGWMVAVVRQHPCRHLEPGHVPNAFANQCYSDIPALFAARGLIDGNTPFFDRGAFPALEYPVLTGWFVEINRLITVALGAPVGPGLDEVQSITATNLFYSVNMVVLFIFWLITVFAQVHSAPGRGWDVLMLAASPLVVLTGLINWDLFTLALTALGVMLWARGRPGWAGLLWGLAAAAKFYPLFLMIGLLALCLRSGRMRDFGRAAGMFAAGWLAPNLPVMILAWEPWTVFWTFNAGRGAELGSMWYLLELGGGEVPAVRVLSLLLLLAALAGVVALVLKAPQRPRLAQVCFLVLMAVLLTNRVYSPQHVLWVLPFLALCRPRWRDWLIFTIGEWLYVMAVWGHLGGYLAPAVEGPDRLYGAAIVLRLGTQVWLVTQVVRDVLSPERDLVRATAAGRGYVDDPSGGVLDGAPDVRLGRKVEAAA
ncbi:MAG: glycosyltransferase 87 family protein [Propionibacteriaceae bacterium]|nr:glycosyltransferase 87 family protein [Propionibacteriaceae bacterium]